MDVPVMKRKGGGPGTSTRGGKSGGGNGAADAETAMDVGVLDKRLKAGRAVYPRHGLRAAPSLRLFGPLVHSLVHSLVHWSIHWSIHSSVSSFTTSEKHVYFPQS